MRAPILAPILIAAIGAATLLSGCASVGGPGSSTYFECDRGTRLKVDYGPRGALVRINGGRSVTLRANPTNAGASYEGRSGERLSVMGNSATWNTALRMAPETCRAVAVPR